MKQSKYGMSWIYSKTKGVRMQLALYSLLVLCIPVLQLMFSYFMKLFIDIAAGNLDMPLTDVTLRTILVVAAGSVMILVNVILSKWICGKLECSLRAELLDIIFSRRFIDISRQHTGELLTKLTADVGAVSTCPTSLIDNILGGGVSALLATAALFFLNWKIAIILLLLIPLLMFVMGAFTPHIQKASVQDKGNDEANRSMIQENLSRIMLIKTYFMQAKMIEKAKDTYSQKLKSSIILGVWEGFSILAGTLFGNIMSMVTLGLGAYFVLKGETTVGSLIMIVQLLNYIVTPVSKFPVAIAQMSQSSVSAGRIGVIYDLPADRNISPADSVAAGELVIKNLCFSYNSGEEEECQENLLDRVNMTFSKGEVTGIVGKSGSGKSTLLKLLMGLYTPETGTVELKYDSGTLTGEEIMSQIAYVPPSDYLFSGSVSENIVMSESEPQYETIRSAAVAANIMEFVQSLPGGFDTRIGENGGMVSSGQAQRIAIARAIYKNAAIVVFDEPTANLDADSIEKFQATVRELAKDKICVIVTHDTSMITVCDRVYTLSTEVC